MLLALLVWVFAVVIVGLFAGKFWWFPETINAQGRLYDQHFMSTLIVTGIIFFLAQVALGWVIFRYRSNGGRANYVEGNNKLEVLWTSGAAILFIGAVLMSTNIWASFHLVPAPADALKVEALAKQFAFSFRYPGMDGKYGRTDLKLINDASGNPWGLDYDDKAAQDDITSASIRVPAGRAVELTLKSRDVIHNFFVRELRLKQDMVPGMEIPIPFLAEKPGTYEVPCSELCGLGHSQMRTVMIVMPPDEFDAWLKEEDAKMKQLFAGQ